MSTEKIFMLDSNLKGEQATRSVSDMAAFFGYKLRESAEIVLSAECSEAIAGAPVLKLQTPAQCFTAALDAGTALRSEQIISLKRGVLDLFAQLTGERPELPWGILTGVRPGKLLHKLLDENLVTADAAADYLERRYLVPQQQGRLLLDIVLHQKKILSDAARFTDAGIYIGVPYCPSRCSYCSFPSGIVPDDEESQQNFVNLIEQDIKNVVQLLSMHSLNVKSLYIGGGTPTSLREKVFARLLDIAAKNLRSASVEEFTVEAGRPDCFTEGKLAAMENVGVTRVSVNPQTFHDKTLRLIGRRHTVDDFYRAYAAVRKSKIPVVNMDLIVGLPQETEAEIAYSLREAGRLAPENLTIHTLTMKKGAPLFGSQLTLSADAAARMLERGRETALALHMKPYYLYRQHYMLGHLANIGYARPATESLYNIQMMEERHPVLGIGPASVSKNPLADGHHLQRLSMPKNVAVYAVKLAELGRKRENLFKI